jgi:hypothetical protein
MCVSQAWQALGAWPGRAEIMKACAGLGGMAQRNRAHAGLCRPVQAWRAQPSRMEIMRVCISGMAALAGWPSEMEIVQACAGLKVWPGRDHECLWIPSLAGLKS